MNTRDASRRTTTLASGTGAARRRDGNGMLAGESEYDRFVRGQRPSVRKRSRVRILRGAARGGVAAVRVLEIIGTRDRVTLGQDVGSPMQRRRPQRVAPIELDTAEQLQRVGKGDRLADAPEREERLASQRTGGGNVAAAAGEVRKQADIEPDVLFIRVARGQATSSQPNYSVARNLVKSAEK